MPFLLTHIDAFRTLAKKLGLHQKPQAYNLALLGSILPDLEHVGVLQQVHGRCKEFYEYLLARDPTYVPLALGMLTHEIYDLAFEPAYVHKHEASAQLLLKEYYPDAPLAAGHIFVEHTIDSQLVEQKPELLRELDRACKQLSPKHLEKITHHLAFFFHGNQEKLKIVIRAMQLCNFQQLKHPAGMTKLWLNCMLFLSEKHVLEEHAQTPLQKLRSVFRLGIQYSSFTVRHKTTHFKQLFVRARQKFSNYQTEQGIALRSLHKAMLVFCLNKRAEKTVRLR